MALIIDDKGIRATTSQETRAVVEEYWKAAFRDPKSKNPIELNTADYTPQGQLIDSESAIIVDKDAQLVDFFSSIDPRRASGKMQDAIGAVYFLERHAAGYSSVNLLCRGLAGTMIPGRRDSFEPALARNGSGTLFVCTQSGTIGADGTVILPFAATTAGPVPVPADTVTQIYRVIPGWDSVTNPDAGTTGTYEESRLDFEVRRRQSVAKNATGSVPAIRANVGNLEGVTDCYVMQNVSWQEKHVGSAVLSPKSVYVAVAGSAAAEDIANAIYNRNSGGTDTNGSESYTVIDPETGVPEIIHWQTAQAVPFKVRVTTADAQPESVKELIRQAVFNNATGLTGARVRIHDTVYASRFYCALASVGVTVIDIQIARGSSAYGDFITSEIFELLTLTPGDVEVVP